jgi:LytS/YehU family sensor histidine kinase
MEAAQAFFMWLIPPPMMATQPKEAFGALWTASFTNFFLTYSFGIALVTGFALYQGFRDSELRLKALEQGWTAARLAALRMQLSPHTLFNLLHTIRGQINQEPQVARSMVVQLADLLRRVLSAGQRDFSMLSEELSFVRLYLELQQQRFADRLTVALPDADAQPALWVPSLILQPLVENAVIHGLAGHDQAVAIRIEVLTSSETLTLRIINTTAQDCAVGRDGIGLNNVRERLAVQFESQAALRAGPTDATTWVAQITMPALREFSPQPGLVAEVVSDGRHDRR